jgi:tetratricopeptide (TPR) repeat protein
LRSKELPPRLARRRSRGRRAARSRGAWSPSSPREGSASPSARGASRRKTTSSASVFRATRSRRRARPELEEAKDDCAFVLSCLSEAHDALQSPSARGEYVRALTLRAIRAPSDQLAEDLLASGAGDPYEAACTCFLRGDAERAERLARRAHKASPDLPGPLALLAWLEAQKPANQSAEETKKRIAMLDRALRADEKMEQAFYWRGLLHKRIENHNQAMGNFRRVVELNPRHIDAVRELRVYEMRIRRSSISMKAVR